MISVLMRSHNDIAWIRQTVEMLLAQEVDDSVEIIVCDDHSSDGTAEYLASQPNVLSIAPPEGRYIPGKTLNYMVSIAKGDIIVFNNADAIPQNKEYLQHLTAPLKDKSIDCTFGNQIARPDAFGVVRKDYEKAFDHLRFCSSSALIHWLCWYRSNISNQSQSYTNSSSVVG